jgi:hypothetical protein
LHSARCGGTRTSRNGRIKGFLRSLHDDLDGVAGVGSGVTD